jgi:hypothetical protein
LPSRRWLAWVPKGALPEGWPLHGENLVRMLHKQLGHAKESRAVYLHSSRR